MRLILSTKKGGKKKEKDTMLANPLMLKKPKILVFRFAFYKPYHFRGIKKWGFLNLTPSSFFLFYSLLPLGEEFQIA